MSTIVTFGGGISDFSLRSDEEKYPIWDRNAMWTAWVLLEDGTFERLTELVNAQGEPYEGDVLRDEPWGEPTHERPEERAEGRVHQIPGWCTLQTCLLGWRWGEASHQITVANVSRVMDSMPWPNSGCPVTRCTP